MGDLALRVTDANHWVLKNGRDEPIATLQLYDGTLIAHAYGSEQLDRELTDTHIIPLLKEITQGFEEDLDKKGYLSGTLGYVVDVEGQWHHVSEMPDGVTLQGDLDVSFWKPEYVPKHFPKNMTIHGMLWVGEPLEALPEGLTVDTLVVEGKTITKFPKGLNVVKELKFDKETIIEFPDDMMVGGELVRDTLAARMLR